MGKKRESAEVLEFLVDGEDYRRFERFTEQHQMTRDEALRAVLVEGVKEYWPQQLAYMEANYGVLKERLEEYSKDNGTLRRIYSQNEDLRKLLRASK